MVQPLVKRTITKKTRATFRRFQHDRKIAVGESWRRPKGIDNRCRRKYKGIAAMPNVGYAANSKTKHMLASGFFKFIVNNVKELELLMMHNRKFVAEVAHNVSTHKRRDIVERATQLNINVTNSAARLRSQENE